jgi:hypothetical protein
MLGAETVKPEDGWPLRLGADAFVSRISALGLSISRHNPFASIVSRSTAEPDGGDDDRVLMDGEQRALELVANARQLLCVRIDGSAGVGGQATTLAFLNDGDMVARVDVGDANCMIGPPCPHGRFAQLITELASVTDPAPEQPPPPSAVMTRTALEALLALRRVGLFDSARRPLSVATVEGALAPIARPGASVVELLSALESEGLLSTAGEVATAGLALDERFGFLRQPSRLRIDAVELADLDRDGAAVRQLAILGDPPTRVAFVPPRPAVETLDVMLAFMSATPDAVAHGVGRLLSAPVVPPVAPVAECQARTKRWLEPAGRLGSWSRWQQGSIEEIMTATDSGVAPGGLLAPQVTIEVLTFGRGGHDFDRRVFALDDKEAVEWTLAGSLITWRRLKNGDIRGRLNALVPFARTTKRAQVAVNLDARSLAALVAVPASSEPDGSLPEELRALWADRMARWHTARIRRRVNGNEDAQSLLFAVSPYDGTWRFEACGEDAFVGRRVDCRDLADALVSAFGDGRA